MKRRRWRPSLLLASLALALVLLLPPAATPATPATTLDVVSTEASTAVEFGFRPQKTFRMATPLDAEARFDMKNFLPASAGASQGRVADYRFLRALNAPALRAAVGQSPNRDYAKIQAELAAQQSRDNAALLGRGDLSAVLFGGANAGAPVQGATYLTPAQTASLTGWHTSQASWYGPGFYGQHTADGTVYNQTILLLAHKTLPFGTRVAISYGGRTIIAPVKDRGPYIAGRDFDLSAGLAQALGFSGVQTIRWAIVP